MNIIRREIDLIAIQLYSFLSPSFFLSPSTVLPLVLTLIESHSPSSFNSHNSIKGQSKNRRQTIRDCECWLIIPFCSWRCKTDTESFCNCNLLQLRTEMPSHPRFPCKCYYMNTMHPFPPSPHLLYNDVHPFHRPKKNSWRNEFL